MEVFSALTSWITDGARRPAVVQEEPNCTCERCTSAVCELADPLGEDLIGILGHVLGEVGAKVHVDGTATHRQARKSL